MLLAIPTVFYGCAEGRTIDEPKNTCGDGRPRDGEECDNAGLNSDSVKNACRTDCTNARCGDGVRDSGEQCDDGNDVLGDGCDKGCKDSYTCGDDVCEEDFRESCSVCADDCCPCGDGVCTLGELCGECPQDCCVECGNGLLDPGEGCDDGNNVDGDGCSKGCSDEDGKATCGNGSLEIGEVCDDGNTVGSDGCGADCQLEYVCGDLLCQSDVGENCETCLSDCCPNCGDATVNDFEECDGALPPTAETCTDRCYSGGQPTCLPSCLLDYTTCEGELPVCGNGLLECDEACDEDDVGGLTCDGLGYDGGEIGCTATCTVDLSGCGELLGYLDADFDEGCPADWVLSYPWQCGAPTGGPGSAFSQPSVLSTGLSGSYPEDQSYSTATATSPAMNLSQALAPLLTFQIWHDLEDGYDAVQVQMSSDGVSFTTANDVTPAYDNEVGGWTDASGGWTTYRVSLASLVGASTAHVRFSLMSDFLVSGEGVFIDDVFVAEPCGNGVLDPGEVCDGAAVGAAVCPSGTCGTPRCADDCSGIVEGVGCFVPECGNGVVECNEVCDDDDFGGRSCDSLGYDGGDLGCSAQCQLDFDDCGEQLSYFNSTFDQGCPDSWVFASPWQCGAPTGGPGSAFSAPNVMSTGLAGSYPDSQSYASATATSPVIDLSQAITPILTFQIWHDLEDGYDGVQVRTSTDGASFTVNDDVTPAYDSDLDGWTDQSSGWRSYRASLSSLAGQSTAYIRFGFDSDGSNLGTYEGVFIDDILVDEGCGNGSVEGGELCDGDALGSAVCPPGTCGTPVCAADCHSIVDGEGCLVPECGNGVVECEERCDRNDLDGRTCDSLGYDGGDLGCSAQCDFDVADCGELTTLLPLEGFETCPPAGWVLTCDWECGAPTSGPNAANSGSRVLATDLNANYANNRNYATCYAQSPSFPVAGPSPTLSFAAWIRTEDGYDGMHIEANVVGTNTWTLLQGVTPAYTDSTVGSSSAWEGNLGSWRSYTADLSAYDGEEIRLRFAFYSDSGTADSGAYVDDVIVVPTVDAIPIQLGATPVTNDVLPGEEFAATFTTLGGGAIEWLIADGTNDAWLAIDPTSGILYGTPMPADVGPVTVTVRARRPADPGNFDEVTIAFDVRHIVFAEPFTSCPAGFTFAGDWECGAPTNGPAAAHSAPSCIGTNGYANGRAWGDSIATSADIDLSDAALPRLRFWFWSNIEDNYDRTRLEVSANGGAFQVVSTVTPAYTTSNNGVVGWGDYASWTRIEADLSSYEGDSVRLRWSLFSDTTNSFEGSFVDDVVITSE